MTLQPDIAGTTTMSVPEPTTSGVVQLEHVLCPLCDSDDAEPVAVGNDFSGPTGGDSYLAVGCKACGLIYLNPQPPEMAALDVAGEPEWARAAIQTLRHCRETRPEARVLEVAYASEFPLESTAGAGSSAWSVDLLTPVAGFARLARQRGARVHDGTLRTTQAEAGSYDFVVLLEGLERCAAPKREILAARRLLRAGGRLVILTPNAASSVGDFFQGRHWSGYDFPRRLCLFDPASLTRLAQESGFAVERMDTVGCPAVWLRSGGFFLQDWQAPRWLTRSATRPALPFKALASLAEGRAQRKGRGAILRAILRVADGGSE